MSIQDDIGDSVPVEYSYLFGSYMDNTRSCILLFYFCCIHADVYNCRLFLKLLSCCLVVYFRYFDYSCYFVNILFTVFYYHYSTGIYSSFNLLKISFIRTNTRLNTRLGLVYLFVYYLFISLHETFFHH